MSDPLKQFATNLRALRIARGWTQQRLGDEADGMAQEYISRLERADVDPSIRQASRLVKALGVYWSDLMGRWPEPEEPESAG